VFATFFGTWKKTYEGNWEQRGILPTFVVKLEQTLRKSEIVDEKGDGIKAMELR
jgi:hypothetical protein